jgi:predicted transcriptional regulator
MSDDMEPSMKHERSIFDDPEAEAASEARAEADVREGRLISNEAVMRWLKAWISGERLPRPKVGD